MPIGFPFDSAGSTAGNRVQVFKDGIWNNDFQKTRINLIGKELQCELTNSGTAVEPAKIKGIPKNTIVYFRLRFNYIKSQTYSDAYNYLMYIGHTDKLNYNYQNRNGLAIMSNSDTLNTEHIAGYINNYDDYISLTRYGDIFIKEIWLEKINN